MPNTGKPSRDCHLCRKRRVKCDLTRPGCMRCARLGEACPGYREEADLLFRVEGPSSYAKGAPRDRRRTRHKAPALHHVSSARDSRELQPAIRGTHSGRPPGLAFESAHDEEGSTGGESALEPSLSALDPEVNQIIYYQSCPSLVRPLHEALENHAVPLLLSQFSYEVRGTRYHGFLDFLPDMLVAIHKESPLELACKAVAGAYLSNKAGEYAVPERVETYGRALTSVNLILRDPERCRDDAALMCVWFMGLYEIILGTTNPEGPVNWGIHSSGLTSMLKLRSVEKLSTKRGRNLFWLVYSNIALHCLMAQVKCPDESPAWFEAVEKNIPRAELPLHGITKCGYRVSIICARIRGLIDTRDMGELLSNMPSILEEVDQLDVEMTVRLDEVAARWADPLDLRNLGLSNYGRSFLIRMRYSILELLFTASKTPDYPVDLIDMRQQREYCVALIRTLADQVLLTVPHILGPEILDLPSDSFKTSRPRSWSDALRLLWPLRLLGSSPVVLPEQKQSAEDGLGRIAYRVGIRQAVSPYFGSAIRLREEAMRGALL